MPRPVVPMALAPRAASRALSSATCDGRISGQFGEIRSRANTSTPWSIRVWASRNSASSDSTTPLPTRHMTLGCRMPDGISDRTVFLPPMTSVWPALWPPWKRATAAARSVSRSTTLPLPSSPHWVPMMMTNLPINEPRDSARGRVKAWRSAPRRRGVLEVVEELAVRRDHHHVAFAAQGIAVGLQAAKERKELGVAIVGLRVDARGRRLAFTADACRVRQRFRDQLGALAIRLGTHDLRLLVSLAALSARDGFEGALH